MATWWKVSTYRFEIEPVEVVKETPEFVTLAKETTGIKWPERRAKKAREYFKTFSGARSYLMTFADNRAAVAKQEMDKYNNAWKRLFMMEEPK